MALDNRILLLALVALGLAIGGYEAALFTQGRQVGSAFHETCSLAFLVLLVLWVDRDCRKHKNVYRPFDFGFLVFVFWLPYLPYYLVRTRGTWGLVWLLGFVLVSNFGYLLKWIIYLAR